MKLKAIAVLILVALAGCTQKPAPVATDAQSNAPEERPAIAVEYVAIPQAQLFATAADTAPVVGTYGFTEAVSVIEKKGDWCLVRTFEGTAWMKQSALMTAEQSEKLDTLTPRFYVKPAEVPFRTRGELWFQAKVNTDGQVVDVTTIKNTTGSAALATANSDALRQAQFYPMVDKGSRKTFTYEHRVYY